MKKLSTTVTYKVPDGNFCMYKEVNHRGMPPEQRCRFATQVQKGVFCCVMHNMPLDIYDGCLLRKCPGCLKKSKTAVSEPDLTTFSPKKSAELVLREYMTQLNQALSDGYPANIASKLAYDTTLGGFTR